MEWEQRVEAAIAEGLSEDEPRDLVNEALKKGKLKLIERDVYANEEAEAAGPGDPAFFLPVVTDSPPD